MTDVIRTSKEYPRLLTSTLEWYSESSSADISSMARELLDRRANASETRAPLTVWGKPRWTIERPNEPCVNCGCTKFVCTECGGIPFEGTKAPAQKAKLGDSFPEKADV